MHSFWTIIDFVGCGNCWRCLSTTCNRYCLCSSWLVITELKFWNNATHSATSFTTVIFYTVQHALLYSSLLFHVHGSCNKVLIDIHSKKALSSVLSYKVWQHLLSNLTLSQYQSRRWHVLDTFRLSVLRPATNFAFSSLDSEVSKNAKPVNSSLKYHKWCINDTISQQIRWTVEVQTCFDLTNETDNEISRFWKHIWALPSIWLWG